MNRSYTIWVCPACGGAYMFAGSCDDDGARLVSARVVPLLIVQEFRDLWLKTASPVPRWFIEHFVAGLLKYICSPEDSNGSSHSARPKDQLPRM